LVSVGSLVLGCGFLTFAPAIGWMAFGGAILLAVGNGLMWASVVALLSKTAVFLSLSLPPGKDENRARSLAEIKEASL
jgi:hypothetical protein